MKLFTLLSAFFLIYFPSAQAQTSATILADFTSTLQQVSQIYDSNYASQDYKYKMFGWKNEDVVRDLLARAQQDPNLTLPVAQQMLQEFFDSTRDYHAQAYFAKQPYISLPIGMHSAHGRVFISYVAPTYTGPIQVGDEVLLYQKERVIVKLYELATPIYPNASGTDLRDATRRLTARYGLLMDPIPADPNLSLSLVKPDGKSYSETLVWKGHPLAPKSIDPVLFSTAPATGPVPENLRGTMLDDPWGYSSRKSYFPLPATVTWEAPDTDFFYAWTGTTDTGQRVGLIRIPTFSLAKPADHVTAVNAFKALVNKMNAETDYLVIDIQGNRGGMLDYAEVLSSFFFDTPKEAYKFQYKLFPALVKDAETSLDELNQLQTQADIISYFGADHYYGYPVDFDFVNDMKAMYQGLMDDAKAGTLGKPRYYNSASVKPYPGATPYMKPLFVATDAWTVSCGDWFAGFMQDHKRATIIGTPTAGGGAFTGGSVPLKANGMLLQSIVAPIALMYRLDGSQIENLGVTPEYILEPAPSDLKDARYRQYQRRVYKIMNRVVANLY